MCSSNNINSPNVTICAIVGAIVCMVLGVIIYASTRENILFMDWLGISGKHYISKGLFVDWIVYSVPDGLWYMALLLVMGSLGRLSQSSQLGRLISMGMMTIAILLPFLLEFAQRAHVIPGTFDYIDILTYSFTLIIYLVLCKTNFLYFLHCKSAV